MAIISEWPEIENLYFHHQMCANWSKVDREIFGQQLTPLTRHMKDLQTERLKNIQSLLENGVKSFAPNKNKDIENWETTRPSNHEKDVTRNIVIITLTFLQKGNEEKKWLSRVDETIAKNWGNLSPAQKESHKSSEHPTAAKVDVIILNYQWRPPAVAITSHDCHHHSQTLTNQKKKKQQQIFSEQWYSIVWLVKSALIGLGSKDNTPDRQTRSLPQMDHYNHP